LYTRTGDKGETSLYSGKRVGKESARVEAYGAVDELNSQIGAARAFLKVNAGAVDQNLRKVQSDLFVLGGDLASDKTLTKVPRIGKEHVDRLEKIVDSTFANLPKLTLRSRETREQARRRIRRRVGPRIGRLQDDPRGGLYILQHS